MLLGDGGDGIGGKTTNALIHLELAESDVIGGAALVSRLVVRHFGAGDRSFFGNVNLCSRSVRDFETMLDRVAGAGCTGFLIDEGILLGSRAAVFGILENGKKSRRHIHDFETS